MRKTKRNTFTLPIDLSQRLDKIAKDLGLKKSKIVKESLEKFIKTLK